MSRLSLDNSIVILNMPNDMDVHKCESHIAIGSEVINDHKDDGDDIVND